MLIECLNEIGAIPGANDVSLFNQLQPQPYSLEQYITILLLIIKFGILYIIQIKKNTN